MNWAIWIPIIAQNGLEVAARLHTLWASNALPTDADWQTLLTLSKQTAEDKMKQALANAGIVDSVKVAELVNLTKLGS